MLHSSDLRPAKAPKRPIRDKTDRNYMPVATMSGLTLVQDRFAQLPQDMETDKVTINATIAQEILVRNTHNRRMNPGKVNQYTDEMNRGRWTKNGDPIRISKTGVLLDGAHRLTSIVRHGVGAFEYNIVWGLDDESQDTMDVGSKRSLSHSLGLKGESNPNSLGGAVRVIWQIDNDGTPTKWISEATYAEYYEYIQAHPEIRDSTQIALKVAKTLKVPASPIAAAHYYCAAVDKNDADDFFTDLADPGATLAQDSPILQLRHTALKWVSRGSVSRIEQASLYDVCIRAFKDYQASVPTTAPYRLTKRPRIYRTP